MKRTTPYTQRQLNERVRHYCDNLFDRMVKHRIAGNDYDNSKTNAWDITLVAVSCASNKSPFMVADDHNSTTLKKCHPTLDASLPCKLGEKPSKRLMPKIKGVPYPAGHCAEPHAAQKLLNKMSNAAKEIEIRDIDFSEALTVKNKLPMDYCRTCKLTFPQLR